MGGGRVVPRCWVNFQCQGVLLTWLTVGQGPIVLSVGAGGGCLDIFSLIYHFSFLSPSLWESARYRLKYCLKGPLSPKQPTNQLMGCSSSVNQVLEGCDIEFTVKEIDEGYDIPSSTRPTNHPVDIDLLLQKGVYPYKYMDSFDRFQETELPLIGKFYSSLSDESISKKD